MRDWNSDTLSASDYLREGREWAKDAAVTPDNKLAPYAGAVALEIFDRVGRGSGTFKPKDLNGRLRCVAHLERQYQGAVISGTLAWLCHLPPMEFDDGRPPLPLCRKLGHGTYELPDHNSVPDDDPSSDV